MTAEQGKAVKTWVEEGGSLWAFHNNSQASILNKDYRDVEGAIYTGHPPIRPFKVQITNREHPITRGVNDFVVTDEQHYVTYDKDPKYVLARKLLLLDEYLVAENTILRIICSLLLTGPQSALANVPLNTGSNWPTNALEQKSTRGTARG